MTTEDDQISRSGLSRRTVVRAGAWSVPVVLAAAAVPAQAASGDPDVPVLISPNILVLSSPTAKYVVCGSSTTLDTSFTILTTDDSLIPAGYTVTVKLPQPTGSVEMFSYQADGKFSAIHVTHSDPVDDDDGFTPTKVGVLFGLFGGGGLLGRSSAMRSLAAAEETMTVVKTWEIDIDPADPPTYTIENFQYEWMHYTSDSYYIRGGFDVRSGPCSGPALKGTSVSMRAGAWGWSAGIDANSHVSFDLSGYGGTSRGGNMKIEIGEWSTSIPVP